MTFTGILTGLLKPEYGEAGFSLVEDEHFLYLLLKDARIAVFSASGATKESINEECEKWLKGESCLLK